jgi:hypothetical protein
VTGEACGVSNIFTIERLVLHGGGDVGVEPVVRELGSPAAEQVEPPSSVASEGGGQSPPMAVQSPLQSSPLPASPVTAEQGTPSVAIAIEFTTPPSNVNDFVDAFHDGEEVRFRCMVNVIGEAEASGLATRLLDDQELLLMSAEEPAMFTVAETDAS